MRKNGLINKISSKNIVPSVKSMQVLDEQSNVYFNFINSLKYRFTQRKHKILLSRIECAEYCWKIRWHFFIRGFFELFNGPVETDVRTYNSKIQRLPVL